jgi:hypothetical protein
MTRLDRGGSLCGHPPHFNHLNRSVQVLSDSEQTRDRKRFALPRWFFRLRYRLYIGWFGGVQIVSTEESI